MMIGEKEVLNFLRSLMPFSDQGWELLRPALMSREFRKNDFLLEQGAICRSLFYVVKGYCKAYYEIEGEVKNTGFFFENEIVTNINSFGSGEQSEFNIMACEPLTAVVFDREKLFEISKHSTEIETLGRSCIRRYAVRQEELLTVFQLYSAEERLGYLEKNRPELVQRVPLSQLASFLGVRRETLSRIRRRRVSR
ncbi:Crp/Fnr family transcriptional regulator [uncultured Chryseobacterium sp.]|uniref:Crp/Fnr family transcriptional regulator n=1 Tax=uncultured Chryseobacterium sp. TaxID=259322 RepID=UPI0025DE222B|nr:Crp/Fnr family transcriptional regulator [uncultured Chryseobacterium sp.]